MTDEELETRLCRVTDREKVHLSHPGQLSDRYQNMKTTVMDGRKVYVFRYDILFHGENITINRESRFTPVPEHIHDIIEMTYVWRGQCRQTISGRKVTLQEGDAVLLDMNTVHAMEPLSENDIVIAVIMEPEFLTRELYGTLSSSGVVSGFLVDALTEGQKKHRYLLFRRDEKQALKIRETMNTLLKEYYGDQPGRSVYIRSLMSILFTLLLRTMQSTADSGDSAKDNALFLSILRYIEKNYKTCTLEETAAHFGFHPNYLSAYLKKHSGRTYKDWVISERMMQAGILLRDGSLPVEVIAQQTGYDNIGFFYRKFKEYYHLSPAQYRAKFRPSGDENA